MFNSSDPRKTRISNIAMLRTLVAGYLFYLGFTILRDVIRQTAALEVESAEEEKESPPG